MSFQFNQHLEIPDEEHAIFSPSQPSFMNYTDEQIINRIEKDGAAKRGTEDHNFAKLCIMRGDRLYKCKKTLNMHVNDAIGFGLVPEQKLSYIRRIIQGTADAINFENGVLRIHDLKTGTSPAHMEQLEIYAAIFCLEYRIDPADIKVETRIYQNGEIEISQPDSKLIRDYMETLIHIGSLASKYQRERI